MRGNVYCKDYCTLAASRPLSGRISVQTLLVLRKKGFLDIKQHFLALGMGRYCSVSGTYRREMLVVVYNMVHIVFCSVLLNYL